MSNKAKLKSKKVTSKKKQNRGQVLLDSYVEIIFNLYYYNAD